MNKKGERSTYPLNSAMESANLEMVKRLKYTKDILTHMLNANVANINKKPIDIEKDPTLVNPIESDPVKGQAQSSRPQTSNLHGMNAGSSMPKTGATERVNSRPYSS